MKKIFILALIFTFTISEMRTQTKDVYSWEEFSRHKGKSELFGQKFPAQENWWSIFGDTLLDSLIAIAAERNHSVLTAIENMRIARAAWRMERSQLFPTMRLDLGWQRNKTSGNIHSDGNEEIWGGDFDASVSVSWQADIYGSIYKRSQAEKHLFRASEEEFHAVMITLCAEVATTYFSLRRSLAEMAVLRKNAESQREIMNLVEIRYNTGLASKLDVAQARSVYYSTQATIPSMETTIQQYRNALAILLATYPGSLNLRTIENRSLPDIIDPIVAELPANLILRRPDVRSAGEQVEAQASLLGATKREWLPQFYINGSIGFAATDADALLRSRSMTWQIAPSITWNLFDGGRLRNNTRQAQAQLDKSIIEFNNTVLTAMQEVENAMSAYKNTLNSIAALRETVNQGEETLRLSLDLYKQGLTQFQNVLDAQRSLLNYQDYLVQAQGSALIYLIQLYEALGGGW